MEEALDTPISVYVTAVRQLANARGVLQGGDGELGCMLIGPLTRGEP